jgi:phosphatidate cytidylyltransferase
MEHNEDRTQEQNLVDCTAITSTTPASNMKRRVISGGVLLAILIPVILSCERCFFAFVALFSGIIFFEWARIANKKSPPVVCVLLISLAQYLSFLSTAVHTLWFVSLCLYALFDILMADYTKYRIQTNTCALQAIRKQRTQVLVKNLGYIYIFQAMWSLAALRASGGKFLVLYIFFITWITDTGAFFIGKKFGKTKLTKHISPQKTWEGLFGGTLCSLAAVAVGLRIYRVISGGPLSDAALHTFFLLLWATLLISICAHIGDLLESAGKRFFGVKDSGILIPGHGGLADRFDSLLFVSLVAVNCGSSIIGWFYRLFQ